MGSNPANRLGLLPSATQYHHILNRVKSLWIKILAGRLDANCSPLDAFTALNSFRRSALSHK